NMYYGIDSDTAVFPTGATTRDFYAGRIGSGTTADSRYFNTTGAYLANARYAYWGIKGPQSDPNFSTPYSMSQAQDWGARQAAAAISAYGSNSYVNRMTIFADIEAGFGGWYLYTPSDPGWTIPGGMNWGVYIGFVQVITNAGYYCGTYTSNDNWQEIMGTVNNVYTSELWGANWPGYTFNNPPTSFANCQAVNGTTPVMWQYYGETGTHDPFVTGDASIATSLPA
ncbi:MAG TPA: hypothetical protein VJZ04_10105, partial [Lachnospiraceae bacterium]|nr:hypothetical protein [Lachnospiraceae bacterium]